MKKLSIIVPVYNKETDIKRCLDSLINQTLKEIEIIIVDDYSNDNSRKIIEEYSKAWPKKIKTHFNDKNYGIGFTRNKGVSLASGDYLGFVDADDYVDLDMYENYYNFALINKLDLVTGYYTKVGDENQIFKNAYFDICSLNDNPSLLLKIDYGPCNKIFKRDIVSKYKIFFEENLKYEDMPFVLKFLKHATLVGHINKSFYNYYVHPSSETTIVDKRVFDMFIIMDIINDYYVDFNERDVITALNVLQITRYMLQQKYQENRKYKDEFIEKGYEYLDNIDSNWRKNKYYRNDNFFKRIIKNNKKMLKFYCNIMRNN